MTAEAPQTDSDQGSSGCTRTSNGDANDHHEELADHHTKDMGPNTCGNHLKPTSSCDMDTWEDSRQMHSDFTSESSPMLPNTYNPSSSTLEMSTRRVAGYYPHQPTTCDLPSIHIMPSSLICMGRDDKSLLSSSSHRQSSYPYCKEIDHKWTSFRGKSVPANTESFHGTCSLSSSSSTKGGGCSVLLDRNTDLIELTTEDDGYEISRSESCTCSCSSKEPRKWRFSRNKCKSLDCSTKYLPTLQKPIISYLSSGETLDSEMDNTNSCDYNCIAPSSCNTSSSPSIGMLDYDSSLTTVYSSTSNPVTGILEYGIRSTDNGKLNSANLGASGGAYGHRAADDEFKHSNRSFSLTPKVNLSLFETESSDDENGMSRIDSIECDCDFGNVISSSNNCLNINIGSGNIESSLLLQTISAPLLKQTLPFSPSAAQLSIASSMTDGGAPICKICHMTSKDNDPLISPCRCSGTMQFIHCSCLMRWLEISSKKSRKPPSCELCQYQYHWHKKFKVRHWQLPHCSRRDKVLHVLFFISVMIMIGCATITIMCFRQDKGTKVDPDRTELTDSEIVTLVCGVLFFLAFFVAMYVEVKARNTIYKLLVRFVYLNQQWYIDEYEKKESAPVSV